MICLETGEWTRLSHEVPLSPIIHDSVISKLNPQLLHYSKSQNINEVFLVTRIAES